MDYTKLSRFLCLILRHKPQVAGIVLDSNGWAVVDDLIAGINVSDNKYTITKEILEEIVRTDEKGRYAFNEDHTLIRTRQGHSIKVDAGHVESVPPDVLYHGTSSKSRDAIEKDGIKHMSRLYVHLSKDMETAVKVGKRHGEPIVFIVDAAKMHQDGIKFFISENGVWLTDYVAPEYITISQ